MIPFCQYTETKTVKQHIIDTRFYNRKPSVEMNIKLIGCYAVNAITTLLKEKKKDIWLGPMILWRKPQ